MRYMYCVKQSGKVAFVRYTQKDCRTSKAHKGEEVILLEAFANNITIEQLRTRRDWWRKTLKCNKQGVTNEQV
jgi:hypothetical protein